MWRLRIGAVFLVASLYAMPALAEGLADCVRSSGEPAEDVCARAALAATEALRKDPTSVPDLLARADAQLAKGDFNAAIDDYGAAIHAAPHNSDMYLLRGRAYERKLGFADAVKDLDVAIQLNAASVSAHLSRGIAYLYLGQLPQARADLMNATELDPTYPAAAFWLDIALWRSGLPGRLSQGSSLDLERWPGEVARLYAGQSSVSAVLAAAKDPDPTKSRLQACESEYYSGAFLLSKGDAETALPLLRRAIGHCPKGYSGWVGASAELARAEKTERHAR